MSDANWDIEYSKAYDLKEKIVNLCNKNNIGIPNINKRSWELEETLEKLKILIKTSMKN